MRHISDEEIRQARSVDLLSYLMSREPEELVRRSGGYCTRTHDSLTLTNGMWMWWSRGIGGRSALDYLLKVRGMEFADAVENILGSPLPVMALAPQPEVRRELRLPQRSPDDSRVREYLKSRGIDESITDACIRDGIIYESLPHHSAVFVGRDGDGVPRYAAYRGTGPGKVMGDCPGSDKSYSFRLVCPGSGTVHLFESAIDALSYATLVLMNGGDWREVTMLSLGGIYLPGADGRSRLPSPLARLLEESPEVRRIYLHLDNDQAGRGASEAIRENLQDRFRVLDRPPKTGKDMNDYLRYRLGMQANRKRSFER